MSFRGGTLGFALFALAASGCSALPTAIKQAKVEYHAAESEKARQELACMQAQKAHQKECNCSKCQTCEVKESVQSDLNLALKQSYQLASLEVDTEKLKALEAQREDEYKKEMAVYKQMVKLLEERHKTEQIQKWRLAQDLCDGGAMCDCSQPHAPLTMPKIEPFKAPPKPQLRPILSSEIPLKMSLNMAVEMDQPTIRQSVVRQQRIVKPKQPVCFSDCCPRRPNCDGCDECCPRYAPPSGGLTRYDDRLQPVVEGGSDATPIPPEPTTPRDSVGVSPPAPADVAGRVDVPIR